MDHLPFPRPYPIATSGTPQKLTYDYLSKEFRYEYCPDITLSKPTEIFVPPLSFPNHQFDIELSETLSWELSTNNPNVILVSSVSKPPKNSVYIKLLPRARLYTSRKLEIK